MASENRQRNQLVGIEGWVHMTAQSGPNIRTKHVQYKVEGWEKGYLVWDGWQDHPPVTAIVPSSCYDSWTGETRWVYDDDGSVVA